MDMIMLGGVMLLGGGRSMCGVLRLSAIELESDGVVVGSSRAGGGGCMGLCVAGVGRSKVWCLDRRYTFNSASILILCRWIEDI